MDLAQMWQKINSTKFSGMETFPIIQLAISWNLGPSIQTLVAA